jgi:hypothetical protein
MRIGDETTISGTGGQVRQGEDGPVIANILTWELRGVYLGKISKRSLRREIAKAKKGWVQ